MLSKESYMKRVIKEVFPTLGCSSISKLVLRSSNF